MPSYPGRDNILVKLKGNRPGKNFAVSGHLDVVEPGEGWTHPPFEGAIKRQRPHRAGIRFRPGLTKMAHKIDEYIEIDEYEDTIRIFKDMAVAFTESK